MQCCYQKGHRPTSTSKDSHGRQCGTRKKHILKGAQYHSFPSSSASFLWFQLDGQFPHPQKAVHGGSPCPATCEDLSEQDSNVLFLVLGVGLGGCNYTEECRGQEVRENESHMPMDNNWGTFVNVGT